MLRSQYLRNSGRELSPSSRSWLLTIIDGSASVKAAVHPVLDPTADNTPSAQSFVLASFQTISQLEFPLQHRSLFLHHEQRRLAPDVAAMDTGPRARTI